MDVNGVEIPTTTECAARHRSPCACRRVFGELASGNLRNRTIIAHLQLPPQAAVAANDEALAMIEQHKLMRRGVGFVAAHLASAKLSKVTLWARDKILAGTAAELVRNDCA